MPKGCLGVYYSIQSGHLIKKGTFGQRTEGSKEAECCGYVREEHLRKREQIGQEPRVYLGYKKQQGYCGWSRMGRAWGSGEAGGQIFLLWAYSLVFILNKKEVTEGY